MIDAKQHGNNNEIVVIGGGPAGATAATILAQYGHHVTVYERERMPRFHIGESLMPETYWTFERLGVLDNLRAGSDVRKFSVQFVSATGRESQPFYFFETNPHESSQTWQVVRSEFDQMLLDNAESHGARVEQGTRVVDVHFDGDRVLGVQIQRSDGRKTDVPARVVVDATGQSSLIANRLRLRQPDAKLRKASIWTYFRGAHRETGLDEGATLVLQSEGKKSWFWYIPLHDDIVSVGVVASLDYLFRDRSFTHEQVFAREVDRCPAVRRRIAGAERATGFFSTKDFSYRCKRAAGDGWVLIGDAFGFLDPIYSSGVFLALKSGEWAADAIHEGIVKGDLSGAQLGKWVPTFVRGMERMKKLVYAFYDGFSFGRFIRNHPDMKRHIVDLLIGDLFKDSVDEVFDRMAADMDAMGVVS